MKPTERLAHYPEEYGPYFADVFAGGNGAFERGYGKHERYRVTFQQDETGLYIGLDAIRYDADYQPRYIRIYEIDELADGSTGHRVHEFAKGQVPYEAYAQPEFVLRGLLHAVQDAIQARLE